MAALLKTLRDLHELVRRATSTEVSEGAATGL
jgi:hypothetical protein